MLLYIDPGTGSMLISAIIALFSVAFFMLKGVIYRKFSLGGDKGVVLDPNEKYGLVYYSEGKQYWNVFKPLLEECAKRSIPATYLTSDKEDPGLNINLEGIKSIFIGSGREAYFNLNRINADMVIMTTPGLDVLEIKRSKNVGHYCHVTHATSSSGSYKSYSTDYYDSVLVGGEGEVDLIRELEQVRGTKAKEIEIIGHTYLDVLREKLDKQKYQYNFFKNKRTTVLLSPTWGNHGLLTKYGREILSQLEANQNFNVIVRPHPQSYISELKLMEDLMQEFPNNEHRVWDTNPENLGAMNHADIMISDFSGIIFDFFTLFKRPILTINSQYEKRGREAMDLKDSPWDIQMLDKVGRTISDNDIDNLTNIIFETIEQHSGHDNVQIDIDAIMDKYPGESSVRGTNFIELTLDGIKKANETVVSGSVENVNQTENYAFNNYKDTHKSWLIRVFNSLVNPGMLFQMILSASLMFGYIYACTRLLYRSNKGLNFLFLSKIAPYSFILIISFLVLFLISNRIQGDGKFSFIKNKEPIEIINILLISLPMTPIIQYIFANQDILSITDSIVVFSFFAIIAIISVLVIPWILSPLLAKNLSIPVSISFLFIINNMASFGRTTSLKQVTLILVTLYIISFILLFFNKKSILIIVSCIFFVSNGAVSVTKLNVNDGDATINDVETTDIDQHVSNLTLQQKPDIFLLIYDSYANQETLELYGYDNSAQVDYLINNGFSIYDGTYSINADSLSSMAQMLHPSFIQATQREYRRIIAGDASVLQLLKKNGYQTHSIFDSDYLTKDFESQYDFTFPSNIHSIDSSKIIIEAILEGEFRFDADFSTITYEDIVTTKEKLFTKKVDRPRFFYHHNPNPGHSQNSGVLLPNETELHLEKLKQINEEMKVDIDNIRLANKDAIIIIAGDHGPYLTKNGIGLGSYDLSEIDRLDIQDRLGTFLAISWPDSVNVRQYDIKTLQDVFPAVLSYMYDDPKLFDKLHMKRESLSISVVGGARIKDGIILGGANNEEPLFKITGIRVKE